MDPPDIYQTLISQAWLNIILYTILTGANLYYFIVAILKLNEKQFHLGMLTLLQLTYLSTMIANGLKWRLAGAIANEDASNYHSKQLLVYWTFTYLFYSFNVIAHSVFVIKYWVLAKKIESILKGQNDHDSVKKAWLVSII